MLDENQRNSGSIKADIVMPKLYQRKEQNVLLEKTKGAAIQVLLNNTETDGVRLPRTAGFGYPEPYTRDWMLSALGVLVCPEPVLVDGLRRMLTSLAKHQSELGHIPSLADEPDDRGESDTTPLFLFGLAVLRMITKETDILQENARRALTWLRYQSPSERVLVAQQPTSDWRDEQWVLGYGLYVNTLLYAALRLFNENERAQMLRQEMNRPIITRGWIAPKEHEGLALEAKPHYAVWSYKVLFDDRCDVLGNSLAILTGVAEQTKSVAIIDAVEAACLDLRERGRLAVDLPPSLLPFILKSDPDWRERYSRYNLPGEYHNGGIWPFVCSFYIAALVAAGKSDLAKRKLEALTRSVALTTKSTLEYGFNEWLDAEKGEPRGVDWQTWSAALYLFAAECVEKNHTPLFSRIRGGTW